MMPAVLPMTDSTRTSFNVAAGSIAVELRCPRYVRSSLNLRHDPIAHAGGLAANDEQFNSAGGYLSWATLLQLLSNLSIQPERTLRNSRAASPGNVNSWLSTSETMMQRGCQGRALSL